MALLKAILKHPGQAWDITVCYFNLKRVWKRRSLPWDVRDRPRRDLYQVSEDFFKAYPVAEVVFIVVCFIAIVLGAK